MRQKHPKHPANSGRPHPPVLFIFENIERVDLALIFFSSLLVLLWQIFRGTGFPNQFFGDSWVVGFWRGRPWLAGNWIGVTSSDAG